MKSLFLCSLTLLLAAFTTFPQPEILWSRTYGGSDADEGYCVQQTADGGFILTGCTGSHGAGSNDIWLIKTNENGDTLWTKTFGGNNSDIGKFVQPTTDGGYIVVGNTYSFGAGGYDIWLIKTDSLGNEQWNQLIGGVDHEQANCVQQTTDGGYIISGRHYTWTNSDILLVKTDSLGNCQWSYPFTAPGDQYGREVQQTTDGGYILVGTYSSNRGDVWLIKTDSLGVEQWSTTFGRDSTEYGKGVKQTVDGGYIVLGETDNHGTELLDVWLVKTDGNGDTLWTRTLGGNLQERAHCVQQTNDRGYVIFGTIFSGVNRDYFIIKTDSLGYLQWMDTYGGTDSEYCMHGIQTTDGGYVMIGNTSSFGAGGIDFWLVRLEAFYLPFLSVSSDSLCFIAIEGGGNPENQTFQISNMGDSTFTYTISEDADWLSVIPMSGGPVPPTAEETVSVDISGLPAGVYNASIIVTATSFISNIDTVIVTLEIYLPHPDTLWTSTFGGSTNERGECVKQTNDGGFIVLGQTYSLSSSYDVLLIKTDSDGNLQWERTIGGNYSDRAYCVQQTIDGGFVLTGSTNRPGSSDSDIWLIKTDPFGNNQWDRTYGGTDYDVGYSVLQTNDEGYIIAGYTRSFGSGYDDAILIKVNGNGNVQWQHYFGGSFNDCAINILMTDDSGYILNGRTQGTDFGDDDAWVVKTDYLGVLQWSRSYGTDDDDDMATCVRQSDDEYIVVGCTNPAGSGLEDAWVIKIDEYGNSIWSCAFGSSGRDVFHSLELSQRETYVIAGYTSSFGSGLEDVWLVETDADGNVLLSYTIGGDNCDIGKSLVLTPEGSHIIAGTTASYGSGGTDIWMINLGTETFVKTEPKCHHPNQFILHCPYPNPFNPTTTINYEVPLNSQINIIIYNTLGRNVATIFDGEQHPGHHTITWNATDIPSGIYFCRMFATNPMEQAGTFTQIQKLVLLK